jgi:hypothetical protein
MRSVTSWLTTARVHRKVFSLASYTLLDATLLVEDANLLLQSTAGITLSSLDIVLRIQLNLQQICEVKIPDRADVCIRHAVTPFLLRCVCFEVISKVRSDNYAVVVDQLICFKPKLNSLDNFGVRASI